MPNLKININKTTGNIQFDFDDKDLTEEMNEKVQALCKALLTDNNNFKKDVVFQDIYRYISNYDRILYAPISNMIYACYNDHTAKEATDIMGTINSNIIAVVNYSQGKEVAELIKGAQGERKKHLQDTKKVILKIWDHINLAHQQYSALKQSDAEYEEKFNKKMIPIKEDLSKDLSQQLLTMVSIFTALAFLIFGGISSLDNIFANQEIPILKLMIVGSVWGLCILNLIFVFLFCVGKMTKLKFTSTDNPDATIFQKYPIVWWSNLVIVSIMILSMWGYYITKRNIHTWFDQICFKDPMWATIIGTGVILVVIIFITCKLIKATKHTNGADK